MRILITGSYGQLGNEMKILSANYPHWEFVFTDVDTLDIGVEKVVAGFLLNSKPDIVVNCAAYTAVDQAESDIETASRINAIAPGILAKAAKNISAKMIHISTDYVFSGKAFLPLAESDEVNPSGIYGKTKLKGEENCQKENTDSIVIRTSWLYSSFGNNFVKTMLRLGKERNSLNVVYDQVGTPTYAADLAKAIFRIIEISEKDSNKFVPGIYHYSNEGVISWFDFAKAIFEITGIKCEVLPVLSDQFPLPAERPNYSVLNKSKFKNTFGITIPYWKDSLQVCLEKMDK